MLSLSSARLLRVGVLSDTHLRPGGRALPRACLDVLDGVDVILHAGDVVTCHLLVELAELAPVQAVLGNNDDAELRATLPERRVLELAGVRVAMVHDSGARAGRPARLRRWFPDADVVVFGHSHQPVDEEGIEGQRLFNPGSPTQKRRALHPTMGLLTLADGRIASHEVIRVDGP